MTEFSALGYAAIGGLYALLTILLSTSWRGHRIGGYLIIACIVSAAWGVVLAFDAYGMTMNLSLIFLVEVLRPAAWLTFLVVLAAQIGVSHWLRYFSAVLWMVVLGIGGYMFLTSKGPLVVERVTDILIPGGLVMALTGLILIEQLYRNSQHQARWGLKVLVLGVGGVFAYDLFLYSQAMLFGVLDSSTWMARGAVNVLFVPLIAIAARRNPTWDLDIFVSRQVVFYTTSLVAVGTYLLLMSLGGYALVFFGGSWGALAQAVFFVGALIVLFFLLFSSTMRARLKVFLVKHFFRNKYDYREEWLRLVTTLSEFEDSSTRDVVVKAVAQIVGSTAGLLWVYRQDEDKFFLDARYGYDADAPDLKKDDTLLQFILKENWIVDLAEFDRNPSIYAELVVPDWVRRLSRPWLFVPLMFGNELIGLIMLTKAPAVTKLNYEDRDLLKTVASHVAVHLAQARSERLLAEAQQFEAYNKLTAFLMHDLNNLIAQQSLIVANAEKHKRNPSFIDDTIETVANSVKRMNNVMEQLKRREPDRALRPIALRSIVLAAADHCSTRQPTPSISMDSDIEVKANPEEFIMVLSHLIRNAQDATPESGSVGVAVRQLNGAALIQVTDTGSGMSQDFIRERLFRPFDSTKGAEGMGIGAYQAREFARKLGGELRIESKLRSGTTVTISLPLG